MKNIFKIFVTAFIFLGNFLLNAQAPPPPGGGVGGNTPETAAAPIDMYVYILAMTAVLFIVFYTKRLNKKQTV